MQILCTLPAVISTLEILVEEGDDEDRRWARWLLEQFGGTVGFERHST